MEIVDELLKVLPHRTPLGEDWLPLLEVCFEHGGDHGDGPGGALVSSMAGDLLDSGRDVPQVRGNGAPSRIYRVDGNSGSVQEGMDL